jgi:hypothetical protein
MSWDNDNIPELVKNTYTYENSVLPPPQIQVPVVPKVKSPRSIILERLIKTVPIRNPIFEEARLKLQEAHKKMLESLTPFELYTITQTIHHGDKLCNYFLRGSDTLSLYDNMYSESVSKEISEGFYRGPWKKYFFFLPLFYMNYPEDKDYHHFDCLTLQELFKLHNPSNIFEKKIWDNYIFPNIEAKDKEYFRSFTWKYIQDQLKIMKNFPKAKNYFVTYRGIDDNFIKKFTNPNSCYYFHSYQSTSVSYNIAYKFAKDSMNIGAVCTFWVHPSCDYVYLEPVSVYREDEILLAPGHRAIFLYKSNQNDNYHFMILPPDAYSDLTKVNNIRQHIKNLTSQAPNVDPHGIEPIYERNANTNNVPPSYADGGSKKKKSKRKTRKQKRKQNKIAQGGFFMNKITNPSSGLEGGAPKTSFSYDMDLVTVQPITQAQIKERERLFNLINM